MKLLLAEQMHEVDQKAINLVGIPELVLMENAGRAVAETVDTFLEGANGKRVVILTGKGNNGGDGLVAARLLEKLGAFVYVLLLEPAGKLSPSAAKELAILKTFETRIYAWSTQAAKQQQIMDLCAGADVVVDAMLGTGFKGSLRNTYAEAVEMINLLPVPVIAVDIPSGVEANTGKSDSGALAAQLTVTMIAPKPGLYLYPGAQYTGDIIVADLGTPEKLLDKAKTQLHLLEDEMIAELLPLRKVNAHKGNNGRIDIMAGNVGYVGAAVLSSSAAVRAGGGLVTLMTPEIVWPLLATKLNEVMVKPFNYDSLAKAVEETLDADVLVLGPGMGQAAETQKFIRNLLPEIGMPLLLDADALNALAGHTSILRQVKNKVLTPHPGEMARLMGISTKEVLSAPMTNAAAMAKKWQAVVVLKCTPTIIAWPDGKIFLNSTGNEGMATGGAGDVLTGVIAAFIGQGLSTEEAALCGVYVHGLAGDLAAQNGKIGLKAGDLVQYLPLAIKTILEGDNGD